MTFLHRHLNLSQVNVWGYVVRIFFKRLQHLPEYACTLLHMLPVVQPPDFRDGRSATT